MPIIEVEILEAYRQLTIVNGEKQMTGDEFNEWLRLTEGAKHYMLFALFKNHVRTQTSATKAGRAWIEKCRETGKYPQISTAEQIPDRFRHLGREGMDVVRSVWNEFQQSLFRNRSLHE